MSRISQTRSLLSNLSSFSVGLDTASEDESIIEQFLPRRQDAMFGDQFIYQTASLRQRITAKLVLLPPLSCDVPPLAKSVIYLSSLSGSINATVYRLPGAENHCFRLSIFTREANVKVTLPSSFRGVVSVRNRDGLRQKGQVRYCRAFRERLRCGLVKLNSYVPEEEDEVYIHAEGHTELRLMPMSRNDGSENISARVGRHVRRIFGTT